MSRLHIREDADRKRVWSIRVIGTASSWKVLILRPARSVRLHIQ